MFALDGLASLVRRRVSRAAARAASRNPLVVFAAPIGYGKTIAMRDVVATASDAVAWLTLGTDHVSAAGFTRALLAAVEPRDTIRPGVVSSVLRADELADPQAVGLFLAERLERLPRTIVLDDFGVTAGDSRIARIVESAIERTRDRCRWLIASRDLSSLPLSRWCANGFVDDPIDERELRFDSEDAVALASAWNAPVTDRLLAALLDVTGGWPLAFSLGLRARMTGDSEAVVLEAARARMYAFFAERVIAPSSPDERRFFFATCLFDEMTSEALAAFHPDATTTMARVRAATSFVHSGPDGAFRYHPVFRDFLRDRLSLEGPDACARAEEGVFRTLGAIDRHADCIRLAMRSGTARLVETLRERGRGSIDRGEFDVLRDALGALPADVRTSDPDVMNLLAHVGSGEMPSDFDAAYEGMLAREASPTRRATLALGLAARFARTGRGREAFDLLDRIEADGVEDDSTRARLLAEVAALGARCGAVRDVAMRIEAALGLVARFPDDVLGAAVVNRYAAEIALADERPGDAVRLGNVAVDFAVRSEAPRIELRSHAILYRASLELGRYDNARASIKAIASRAVLAADLEMTLFVLAADSDAAADCGDEAWLDELDAARDAAGSPGEETFVESLQGRLGDALVRSRALRRAWDGRFAQALRDLDRVDGNLPMRRSTAAEAAVYAAAAGDVGRASGECARVRADLETARNAAAPGSVLARLLVALASIVSGDETAFVSDVTALEAIADRITLPHICFLRALRALHEYAGNRASRHLVAAETAAMAANGLGGYAALLSLVPIRASVVVPTAVLTGGEIRVLELLCDGLTSREIALRLERSVLTIDSHVKSIVKKLACTGGRREAVAMARDGRVAGIPARLNFLVG
jgi:DNA-binding CsgD family transcriptional regulator